MGSICKNDQTLDRLDLIIISHPVYSITSLNVVISIQHMETLESMFTISKNKIFSIYLLATHSKSLVKH